MRSTLTTALVLALSALATPLASPASADAGLPADLPPLALDLTGLPDHTRLVTASSLPLPAQATGIGPGSHLLIKIGSSTYGCTANFVWADGSRLYLGTAGHCLLPEEKVSTHGHDADFDASGVRTFVCVADCSFGGKTGFTITGQLVELGKVAYARQELDGRGTGHDFGLVEIPSSLHAQVRAAMPVWGGPTGSHQWLQHGAPACHYGAGVVVGETWPTMARAGVGHGSYYNVWYASLVAAFGDSGSAVVGCAVTGGTLQGTAAIGVATHGVPGYVAGTTIPRAQDMAREAGLSVNVVLPS